MRYMSPEQALGQIALIDHRTDIYSLGATLYELLTLEPAFPGDEGPALIRQHRAQRAAAPAATPAEDPRRPADRGSQRHGQAARRSLCHGPGICRRSAARAGGQAHRRAAAFAAGPHGPLGPTPSRSRRRGRPHRSAGPARADGQHAADCPRTAENRAELRLGGKALPRGPGHGGTASARASRNAWPTCRERQIPDPAGPAPPDLGLLSRLCRTGQRQSRVAGRPRLDLQQDRNPFRRDRLQRRRHRRRQAGDRTVPGTGRGESPRRGLPPAAGRLPEQSGPGLGAIWADRRGAAGLSRKPSAFRKKSWAAAEDSGQSLADLALAHGNLGLLQNETGDAESAAASIARAVELQEQLLAPRRTIPSGCEIWP